jgi:hypothetical protein
LDLTGVTPVRLFRASSEQGAEGSVISVLEVQWRLMRSVFSADELRGEVVSASAEPKSRNAADSERTTRQSLFMVTSISD